MAWRENLEGEEEEEFNIVDIDQPDIFRWGLIGQKMLPEDIWLSSTILIFSNTSQI